jgi:transaldolase
MTKLQHLSSLGQSIWLDFIRRSFVDSGELKKLVEQGIRGVTSNPTIFDKAISGSSDYDNDMRVLIGQNKSDDEIYEALVIEDIRRAADVLMPVYLSTNGDDGYVSLEVRPTLANDSEGTIQEARSLVRRVGKPNLMIKVPATKAGFIAVERLLADGISVNVTLIFGIDHYRATAEAYLRGMEKLVASGGVVRKVASVASFFVSRLDTMIDAALEQKNETSLAGKIAIANCKRAYRDFKKIFSGARWERLAKAGVRMQRPLWASTGTKNPRYSEVLYVDNLIGDHTVNTLPPQTIDALFRSSRIQSTIESDIEDADRVWSNVQSLGIDLNAAVQKLQDDGILLFTKSFESLMKSIAAKRKTL